MIACSVSVGSWNLEEHSVIECEGFLCDATSFQIPDAPQFLVAELDEGGHCRHGKILYGPCVSQEYVEVIANTDDMSSEEAVDHGVVSEQTLRRLLRLRVGK